MFVENTTCRLLKPSYLVERVGEGNNTPEVRSIDVLPGCHDIDPDSANAIRGHKNNACFFDAGWLKFGDGSAPKIEQPTDKGPSILRVHPRAIKKAPTSKK